MLKQNKRVSYRRKSQLLLNFIETCPVSQQQYQDVFQAFSLLGTDTNHVFHSSFYESSLQF